MDWNFCSERNKKCLTRRLFSHCRFFHILYRAGFVLNNDSQHTFRSKYAAVLKTEDLTITASLFDTQLSNSDIYRSFGTLIICPSHVKLTRCHTGTLCGYCAVSHYEGHCSSGCTLRKHQRRSRICTNLLLTILKYSTTNRRLRSSGLDASSKIKIWRLEI